MMVGGRHIDSAILDGLTVSRLRDRQCTVGLQEVHQRSRVVGRNMADDEHRRRPALVACEPGDPGRGVRAAGRHVGQGAGVVAAVGAGAGAAAAEAGGVRTVGASPATCWQLGVQA